MSKSNKQGKRITTPIVWDRPEIHTKVKKLAKSNRRTIGQQVLHMIETQLEQKNELVANN